MASTMSGDSKDMMKHRVMFSFLCLLAAGIHSAGAYLQDRIEEFQANIQAAEPVMSQVDRLEPERPNGILQAFRKKEYVKAPARLEVYEDEEPAKDSVILQPVEALGKDAAKFKRVIYGLERIKMALAEKHAEGEAIMAKYGIKPIMSAKESGGSENKGNIPRPASDEAAFMKEPNK